ncbi:leucine-rich repeat-containing protein 14 isoform X1 [Ambystoma mexicanum]
MCSLVFLCARKVVSDHSSIHKALDFIPKELYPVLFKAAFIDKKTLVLRDLVHRWPFTVLSFRKLLEDTNKHEFSTTAKEEPSKLCVQTVILGVIANLNEGLALGDKEHNTRRHQLRLLDMTGLQDGGINDDPQTMSLWSRTVTLAKACIEVSKRQCEEAKRAWKRRKGMGSTLVAANAPDDQLYVEVRVDLFVNSTSYGVLREALQVSTSSPLRLKCRDFRAEELSIRSTVGLLELLDSASVRQVDLRFNNLGLSGLNMLLPYMAKFPSLLSLKLPYNNIDVRRLSVEMEKGLQSFATEIGRLSSLKELNLGASRLSGRLRQLLGGLNNPLESLELAFCHLLPSDISYLSESIHVPSLKKLDLSGNNLSELLLHPFQRLISRVSASLLYLDIMECKLTDTHLEAILPSIYLCSKLRYLGIFCNPISCQGLKTFVLRSTPLHDLQLVIYPYPVDCYSESLPWPTSLCSFQDTCFIEEKMSQFTVDLHRIVEEAHRTDVVWTTDLYKHRTLEYLNL